MLVRKIVTMAWRFKEHRCPDAGEGGVLAHCDGSSRVKIGCQILDVDEHTGFLRSVGRHHRESEVIASRAAFKNIL